MEEKRLKIAFLNISQGLVERGSETFISELSKRLSNYEVEILSGKKIPGPRWPFLWRVYLDPHSLSILLFTLRKIPKLIIKRYDIVFVLNGGWQSLIIRLITWCYGGKLIISGQSGKGWDDRVNLWCFPNVFVSLSQNLKVWANKINRFVKTVYIPNGVDIKKFIPMGPKINFDLEKPVIICVGALTEEKRIELAVKAVSKLGKGSLLVIGKGPLKDRLKELGNMMLRNRFLLTSSDYEEMPLYLRGADLFTLPSPSYRSFEIVIVEAMACGLAVVVNDDPIRKEIVGSAGLFVDPEDIEHYSKCLKRALELNWGKKPRNQAEKFSWDKIAEDYEILFKELI